MKSPNYIVRDASSNEFSTIGNLMVEVYSQLKGFPSFKEQPAYYKMLANIGNLTNNPKTKLIVAISTEGKIAGGVVYFGDMKYYASGGTATDEKDAAGFRLLAVDSNIRGKGIGKLLTNKCIEIAQEQKQKQLIIHSTKAMKIAWNMYETIGFKRSEDLDFMQENLSVFGFRLYL
jgi:GNAT superfamily N-acetyltransferase